MNKQIFEKLLKGRQKTNKDFRLGKIIKITVGVLLVMTYIVSTGNDDNTTNVDEPRQESRVETSTANVTSKNSSVENETLTLEDKINHNRSDLLKQANLVESQLHTEEASRITLDLYEIDYNQLVNGSEFTALNDMAEFKYKTIEHNDKQDFIRLARETAYQMNKLLADNNMEVE